MVERKEHLVYSVSLFVAVTIALTQSNSPSITGDSGLWFKKEPKAKAIETH